MIRYIVGLLVLALALPTSAQQPLADIAGEPDGSDGTSSVDWVQISPGGDTNCAFETPFSFFFREVPSSTRLLVYFEGGGACWEGVSCSGMFDTNVSDDELDGFAGIFDFANPANPFVEHSVVFVPYCTGDVHIGDTIQFYGDPASSRPVAHRGFRNVSAVLGWLEQNLSRPFEYVTISGTSAGSYGAVYYAPRIADLFPSATVSVIGDSGVPLLHEYPEILRRWGSADVVRKIRPQSAGSEEPDLSLEGAHRYFGDRHPGALIAQATSDRDGVQSGFYLISGSPRAREVTYALLDSVAASVPRFRSFVVEGGDHGLFVSDRFYSYTADGDTLADWIGRAALGQEIGTRRCGVCKVSSAPPGADGA